MLQKIEDNNRRPLRKIYLKAIDEKAITDKGLIDNRLFKGETCLIAEMDKETTLWSLRYEHGRLPEPLRQRWTGFPRLLEYIKIYFNKRNIEIARIED